MYVYRIFHSQQKYRGLMRLEETLTRPNKIQIKTISLSKWKHAGVLQSLVLFSEMQRNDILPPRGKWMRQKEFSLFSAPVQMRRGHISRRAAVKQGYYAEWGFEEKILTCLRNTRAPGLPAVCESFFKGDSVKFPHLRCWPADAALHFPPHGMAFIHYPRNFVSYEWRSAKFS